MKPLDSKRVNIHREGWRRGMHVTLPGDAHLYRVGNELEPYGWSFVLVDDSRGQACQRWIYGANDVREPHPRGGFRPTAA